MRLSRKGLTLVEVMIVVIIIAILASVAFPNFIRARARVQRDSCINNLRQLKLAKERWALDYDKESTDTPDKADVGVYVRDGIDTLKCPADPLQTFDSSYTTGTMGSEPTCLIDMADHHL